MTDVPSYREGVPAFVSAYNDIRAIFDASDLAPGDPVPGEDALGAELGVDRTVVREALLLLEEDSHVGRDAQRRRVVAAPAQPTVGFAGSFHRMLGPGVVAARRLHATTEETSSFVRDQLGHDQPCLVWETIFARDDQLLAATLEFMAVDTLPPGLADDTDPAHHDVEAMPTLLEAIGPERRARLVPQLWRVSPVSRHTERLAWMDMALHAIPAVLTMVLAQDGVPVYVAKNLFDLGSFSLTVDQRSPARG